MLTGRVPYEGTSMQKLWGHANNPPPSVTELSPGLPRALDHVVARAMAKDPDDRFLSAGDLGRAAQAAASGGGAALTELSVASGAAATGSPDSVAPTRPVAPTTQPHAPSFVQDREEPDPATVRLSRSRSPWRRFGLPATILLILALGGAGALLLAGSGDDSGDGGSGDVNAQQAAEETPPKADAAKKSESKESASEDSAAGAEPPSSGSAPARPARYVPYTPRRRVLDRAARGPWVVRAGGNRADAEPALPHHRQGAQGFILIIDYTPLEPAAFGNDFDARRELPHPAFDSMTEYVFSGGYIPECADSTCVDYIVNDEAGGFGYGVLAGGTSDPGLARDVARRVAEGLVYEN